MFSDISCLVFSKADRGIAMAIGMTSNDGEKMEFKQPVECTGGIEEWLASVEAAMKQSCRMITKEATYHYREASSR